jgi:hypothetical protein
MEKCLDQVTLETYNDLLIDFIQSEQPMSIMENSFAWAEKQGEDFLINFILFILYTSDKVAFHLAQTKEISEKEGLYYEKLVFVEAHMEECFGNIGLADVYKKAIEVYATHLNKA